MESIRPVDNLIQKRDELIIRTSERVKRFGPFPFHSELSGSFESRYPEAGTVVGCGRRSHRSGIGRSGKKCVLHELKVVQSRRGIFKIRQMEAS